MAQKQKRQSPQMNPLTVTVIRSTEAIDLTAWIDRYAAALLDAIEPANASKEAA